MVEWSSPIALSNAVLPVRRGRPSVSQESRGAVMFLTESWVLTPQIMASTEQYLIQPTSCRNLNPFYICAIGESQCPRIQKEARGTERVRTRRQRTWRWLSGMRTRARWLVVRWRSWEIGGSMFFVTTTKTVSVNWQGPFARTNGSMKVLLYLSVFASWVHPLRKGARRLVISLR